MLTILATRRRRRRSPESHTGNVVFGSIGWLFADLMFALAMAFLVATTVGQPPRPASVTSSPSPSLAAASTPTPSRSVEPALELEPVVMTVTVNWRGLLDGNRAARQSLADVVRGNPALSGRRAGLVLAYGGAPTDSSGDVDRAQAVAGRAGDVLRQLGKGRFVFLRTAYHEPFISLGKDPGYVKLEIYLFKQPG